MKITKNTVVTVSYVVTDETDQIVGRTDPKRPVVALVGANYLVPGLEQALEGREKGEEFVAKLEPKDAFGEFNDGLVQTIDRAMFGDFPIEVGNAFEADTSVGPRLVVIKEINDTTVVVDGNHPLAGKSLNFMVVVEDVREATEEEIAHGHAHRDGVCPSEEHHCGCGGHGHGHGGCCGGHGHHHHDDEDGEHECCCGHGHHHHHHDDEDGEHECCGGHGHHHHHHDDEDGEHECCCGGHGHHHHHHDDEDGEHECCCGGHGHHHHDDEDGEHKCCGGHGHHHGDEAGEHKCSCGHKHD